MATRDVHIRLTRRGPAGTLVPAAGAVLLWRPTARCTDGDAVVLPSGFVVTLDDNGEATVPVEATTASWCWEVREQTGEGIVRHVAVSWAADVAEYAGLVDVDPATMVPAESAVPAWTAIVGVVEAEAAAAAQAAVDADVSAQAAADSAGLAAGSALAAADSADRAADSESAAAGSAGEADGYAAAALGARDAALGAQSAAELAASAAAADVLALTAADILAADSARQGAETAQGLAESARDAAQAAQGLAESARDTAAGHAADADADRIAAQEARSGAEIAQGLAEDAATAITGTPTGLVAHTAAGANFTTRAIMGTAGKITVTNGDGVSGNPTITIPDSPVLVAPMLTSANPDPVMGANLAPALDGWALAGGASYAAGTITMVSGGSMSCTIAATAGTIYQVDVTRAGASGTMTYTLGAVSADYPTSQAAVTIVASATGTLTLTLGGLWVASITGVTIRAATLATPRTAGIVTRATGDNNAFGALAQYSLTTGSSDSAFGSDAQRSLTTGSYDSAFGALAQRSLTTGSHDSAFGAYAQRSLTTGSYDSAFGFDAQRSLTTGSYDNAFGALAQRSLTTGSHDSAFGAYAQRSLTTGSFDSAFGALAQYSLTTGSSDSAFGSDAQYSLTTGSSDSAFGSDAQRSLTTGSFDSAFGAYAQRSLTTGSFDSAFGAYAQYAPRGTTAWATTTANCQTSVGHQSGQGSAAQSDEITTVGYWAIADGAKATAIGARSSAAHAGSVALGADVTTTSLAQVAVGARDIEIQDATKGVVLRAPDGSRWRATINNAGSVTWTKL